jgi:hypothetical protein
MANIQIKDANGDIKYLKMTGVGSDGDPYIPVQDVNIQDQTSKVKIQPFKNITNTTTLSIEAVPDEITITVASPAGFEIGKNLSIYCLGADTCYNATITNVAGNVVTLDTPLDFPYSVADATIAVGSIDLNIDGSSTSQIYSVRDGDPGIISAYDITRLMLTMETTLLPEFPMWGDIAAGLTNGLVLRKVYGDGTYQNIGNVKSNSELANFCYDMEIIEAAKFGINGVRARVTFAGQEKMGVTIRLNEGEDLQIIVQDNLSTLLNFRVTAQGHKVV